MENRSMGTRVSLLLRALAVIFAGLCAFFIWFGSQHQEAEAAFVFNTQYLVAAILLACAVMLLVYSKSLWMLVGLFALLGILIVYTGHVFNPVDETAHFEYITHLVSTRTLPTLETNYEAMQPPFYYALMALLTFFIKDPLVHIYTLRLINLATLIGGCFVAVRIVQYLNEKGIVKVSERSQLALPTLFFFMTAFFYRSCAAGNEILSSLLTTLAVYCMIKLVVEDERDRSWLFLAGLLVLAILTKFSNIYLLVPMAGVLLYRKQYKALFLSFLAVILGCMPWLLFNLATYGTLTANSQHIAMIYTTMNPSGHGYTLSNTWREALRFFHYFFFSQENYLSLRGTMMEMCRWMNDFMLLFCLLAFCRVLYLFAVFLRKKFAFDYAANEKANVVEILCAGILFALLLSFLYLTITVDVSYITARYLMSATVVFVVLMAIYFSRVPSMVRCVFYTVFFVFFAISTVYNVGASMYSSAVLGM